MSKSVLPVAPLTGATGAAAWLRPAVLPLLVTFLVSGAVWTSAAIDPDRSVHDTALFVHLACLIVGFGAVLAVDWVAILWTARLRTFDDLLASARNAHAMIWCGYAGLVTSGVFLEPDLGSVATRVKIALVFVIGWNGSLAVAVHHQLEHTDGSPSGPLLVVSAIAAALSQVAWWGATIVGFVSSH